MNAFLTMLTQLFTAMTKYFLAFEKSANATVHLATWAEESAGAFADEARIQRQARMQTMLRENKITEKQLNAA